jgi:DNA polymerase-3 subunit alpha
MIEETMALAQTIAKEKSSGQALLFDMLDEKDKNGCDTVPVPDIPEFPEQEILENEKALLGFYVTGHPLGEYAEIIQQYSTHSLIELSSNDEKSPIEHNTGVKIGGIITGAMHRISQKSGNPYCIVQIEDLEGTCEFMVFNRPGKNEQDENRNMLYDNTKHILIEKTPIFVEAMITIKDGKKSIFAENITLMNNVREKYTKELHIRMYEGNASRQMLQKIQNLCMKHCGKTLLIFCVTTITGEVAFIEASEKYNVNVNPELIRELTEIVGEGQLHYKADKSVPQPQEKFWRKKQQ